MAGCRKVVPVAPMEARCAVIVTDDDIPSGSATAGALYVADAKLGKELLAADVVAVAEGFLAGGMECVEVIDSHDGAIDPGPLAEIGVPVWTPSNREDWMWPFIGPMDREYEMAALMGFHTNAGGTGFRAHTINDSIKGLEIEGRAVGEVAHLTMGLAAFGVPVVLVSGDMNATAEAEALVADVEAVTVRWLDEEGEAAFLGNEEAGVVLREAAERAAQGKHEVWTAEMPLEVRLETLSLERMQDRGGLVQEAFAEYLEGDRELLDAHPRGADVLGSALLRGEGRIEGRGLVWEEDSLIAAFGSVAFAAWFMKGTGSGWEKVGEGYRAFSKGKYEVAIAAYEEAIEVDPYDVATRCRMAAVYQEMGEFEEARALFGWAFERLEEVGEGPMKEWCCEGLAEVAEELGEDDVAREAREAREALGGGE